MHEFVHLDKQQNSLCSDVTEQQIDNEFCGPSE